MSKVVSIRLTDTEFNYLKKIQEMRSDMMDSWAGKLKLQESDTATIKHAIYRMYIQTCEYWLDEQKRTAEEYSEIMKDFNLDDKENFSE